MSRKKDNSLLLENRRAHYEYFLSDFLTAGLVLTGTEIKSLRAHNASLADAYVLIRNGEVFLCNMHIAPIKKERSITSTISATANSCSPRMR
jgi:SsrA-binding protein